MRFLKHPPIKPVYKFHRCFSKMSAWLLWRHVKSRAKCEYFMFVFDTEPDEPQNLMWARIRTWQKLRKSCWKRTGETYITAVVNRAISRLDGCFLSYIIHSEMESPRTLPLRAAFKNPSDACAVIASMLHHLKKYSYYIFLFANKKFKQ